MHFDHPSINATQVNNIYQALVNVSGPAYPDISKTAEYQIVVTNGPNNLHNSYFTTLDGLMQVIRRASSYRQVASFQM